MTINKPNICMVHFSFYPHDPRPRREAEALVADGFDVDTICLKNRMNPFKEVVDGVTVYRLPVRQKRGGLFRYVYEYSTFSLLTFLLLTGLYIRKRYNAIQIHNMPDFLVFCAIVPRLFGAKIILDLHDPVPEVFITKFGWSRDHWAFRFLVFIEYISIRFSHLILTPNIKFREVFISRSCPPEKIKIVMNSPDERMFHADEKEALTKDSSKFILMFHGLITERHGLGTALEAIAQLRKDIPHIFFRVYGEGEYTDRFLAYSKELNLDDIIEFGGRVSLEEIAKLLNTVDLGIVPNLKTSFTEINFPTRIFEFISMGKPVIVSRTRGIQDYFDEDSIYYFDPGDVNDLAGRIRYIYENPVAAEKVLERSLRVYAAHRWIDERRNFTGYVRDMLGMPRS